MPAMPRPVLAGAARTRAAPQIEVRGPRGTLLARAAPVGRDWGAALARLIVISECRTVLKSQL